MEENRLAATGGWYHSESNGGSSRSYVPAMSGSYNRGAQGTNHSVYPLNHSSSDIPFIDESPADQHAVLLHSETGFDSSTDETVVPFMIGERLSQEQYGSERFDPEASPKSHLSRLTRRSIDTEQCGTLYEESTEAPDPHILHVTSQDTEEMHRAVPEEPESQRLVGSSSAAAKYEVNTKKVRRTADYRVGSCYHCLVSVPVGSLLAWILLFISIIGWAVSTWLSLYKGKALLQWEQPKDELKNEEIVIIAISIASVLLAVIFLIISTFSSQKLSRYSLNTSRKNMFGYCLSVTEAVFASFSVIFWTGIVSLTMIPIAALTIIHILVSSESIKCVYLPSYGVGVFPFQESTSGINPTLPATIGMTTTMAVELNTTTGIGVINNATEPITQPSNDTHLLMTVPKSDFLCSDDMTDFWQRSWRVMIPLLISLAFAVAVEISMIGFLVAASCNSRHLRERMEYINEPYNYSSENVNGNVKPVNKDHGNNNLTDTQI